MVFVFPFPLTQYTVISPMESYCYLFIFLVWLPLVILIGLLSIWLACRRYPAPQTADVLLEIIIPVHAIAFSSCSIIIWLLHGVEMEILFYNIVNIAAWLTLLYHPPQTMDALVIILPALMMLWNVRLILILSLQLFG